MATTEVPEVAVAVWKTIAAKLAVMVVRTEHPDMTDEQAQREAAELLAGCIAHERRAEQTRGEVAVPTTRKGRDLSETT